MKSLTAKTLTTAAVLGAALLGTVGTSYAADLIPDGETVVGHGTGTTEREAISNALADAGRQCASGTALGLPDVVTETQQVSNGTWNATLTSSCLASGMDG